MKIQLDKRFAKQAKGLFEKYTFDVGVLANAPHNLPMQRKKVQKTDYQLESAAKRVSTNSNLSTYAGGPIRKKRRTASGKTIAQVSESLRKRIGINFYTKPFSSKQNKDILLFVKSFFDLCAGRSQAKRCENLLQAIVRNPILRGDYGNNSAVTVAIKGFDRYMIDTSQLFRAITAKVKVRGV